MFASLGTTLLAVVLFSVVLPLVAAALPIFRAWRHGAWSGAKTLAKANFTATTVFSLCIWLLLFVWSVISSVYDDHERLLGENRQLLAQHEKDVHERARLVGNLERTLEHERHLTANMLQIGRAFSVYRSAIGRSAPCAMRFSATEDVADLAIRISELVTDVTQCVPSSVIESSNDPNMGKEARRGMMPGAVIFHARKDAKGVVPLFNEFSNSIRTVRSYDVPPRSPENFVWLQFGSGVTWSSEQR